MPGFFRCSHSGLLYPADYVKEWGRKYGIGLGPVPISEALDSQYHIDPPKNFRHVHDNTHPVGVCRAQMDYIEVDNPKPEQIAIIDADDPGMVERMKIIREKQKKNPKSKFYQE